jgi:hypothetical protein
VLAYSATDENVTLWSATWCEGWMTYLYDLVLWLKYLEEAIDNNLDYIVTTNGLCYRIMKFMYGLCYRITWMIYSWVHALHYTIAQLVSPDARFYYTRLITITHVVFERNEHRMIALMRSGRFQPCFLTCIWSGTSWYQMVWACTRSDTCPKTMLNSLTAHHFSLRRSTDVWNNLMYVNYNYLEYTIIVTLITW